MEGTAVRYLLDTAVWLNSFLVPGILPSGIRRLLAAQDHKLVCTISLLETAILHRLGRIQVNGPLADFLKSAVAEDVELVELTPAIAAATNDLPRNFQGDPFDRTIAASAKVLGLTLITPDERIRDSGVCQVEFYRFKLSRLGK